MFLPFIGFGQSGNFGEMTGCISGNCVNGQGKRIYNNGDYYEGNFKDGKRSGNGVYTFASGAYYSGRFLNGNYHGEGAKYNSSGTLTKKGKWINDVYQTPKTSNTSTWKPPVKAVCNRKSKLAIAD